MGRPVTFVDEKVVRRLVSALAAMLAWETMVAQNSYTEFVDRKPVWNDDVWKRANLASWKRAHAARRALAAAKAARP